MLPVFTIDLTNSTDKNFIDSLMVNTMLMLFITITLLMVDGYVISKVLDRGIIELVGV